MEKRISLPKDIWEPLKEDQKDAEKIERPSLTFLQDGWRRLKRNKVAIISMVVIIMITVIAIFVPMFWEYSYDQQDLSLANIPSNLSVYKINDKSSIYIAPEFTAIEITSDGYIKKLLDPVKKDLIAKKNIYELDGESLIVDYSLYSEALAEYKKIEKQANYDNNYNVEISKVKYLKDYYRDNPEIKTIVLQKAKRVLENEISRVTVIYNNKELTDVYKVRNKTHIMGTDNLGRDLFIRVVYGARISLTVGFIAALINLLAGVLYGGIAGYMGGRVDNIMMRIVDAIDSIPMTLYVILIMVVVGSGMISIILALGLTFWVKMARIVRGQVLTLKQQEFVKAAIVIGADTKSILIKHLVPNMMGPIMVAIAMQIPSAIFTEAFLSFIGLGISAPQASWGTLANDALAGIYVYPYQMFYPALAISITILSFNLFSDGARDAFDPRLRK